MPVDNLNEIELIDGYLYANVWYSQVRRHKPSTLLKPRFVPRNPCPAGDLICRYLLYSHEFWPAHSSQDILVIDLDTGNVVSEIKLAPLVTKSVTSATTDRSQYPFT